jgi:hypothetical protein
MDGWTPTYLPSFAYLLLLLAQSVQFQEIDNVCKGKEEVEHT